MRTRIGSFCLSCFHVFRLEKFMTPPKKDEAKVLEDDMEERLTDAQLLRKIGKSLGVTYRDSRRWIKEEVPPLAWGHEDVLEIVRRVRLAGRREGAAEQRERDAQIAENPYSNLVQV